MNLGLLVSGNLGFDTLKKLAFENTITFVFTDGGSTDIVNWCQMNEIPYYAGNPREGRGVSAVQEYDIDVLVSINYLFLIEKDLIQKPRILAFNLHGSLLPKYRGRTPHVWAIINNETKTGITAHEISEGCDTGRIIKQIEIPITANDTGGTILEKFTKLYFPLVTEVLTLIKTNNLQLSDQNESEATFYGKRTPDDGLINWEWDSTKIRNWVRAQSNPYPGAFTFLKDEKVIVDWVEVANIVSDSKPGEIISAHPILIKTGNGAIEITKLRVFIELEKGEKFTNE